MLKSVKGDTIATMILMTAWNIFDYLIRDEATLGGLLGSITANLINTGVGSLIGAAAGSLAVGTLVVVSMEMP